MQLISGKFRKTHAVPILSLLIKSIPHKSVNIPEHTAPPSFTIPPPPFILDAAKLLHLALWIEQSWLCRIMRLTKREDHSKLTPFLPIFKKFSCHINHILRTITGEKYQPSMPASSYQAVLRSAQENGSCKEIACFEKCKIYSNTNSQPRISNDTLKNDTKMYFQKVLKMQYLWGSTKIIRITLNKYAR